MYIVQEHGIVTIMVGFASKVYHCRLMLLHIVGKPPVGKASLVIVQLSVLQTLVQRLASGTFISYHPWMIVGYN